MSVSALIKAIKDVKIKMWDLAMVKLFVFLMIVSYALPVNAFWPTSSNPAPIETKSAGSR